MISPIGGLTAFYRDSHKMTFDRRRMIGALAVGAAGLAAPRCLARAHHTARHRTLAHGAGHPALSRASAPAAPRGELRPGLLPRALAALDRHDFAGRDVIGLVDFSAPSREPRFHIVDLAGGHIRETLLVAHGRGSDPANSGYVEQFSNRFGSNASSGGAFRTGDLYHGAHGRSRRLTGLDAENCLAQERGIVIHAAAYVDPHMAATQGRIGRSEGCFAVAPQSIALLLDALGPGRLIYAAKA